MLPHWPKGNIPCYGSSLFWHLYSVMDRGCQYLPGGRNRGRSKIHSISQISPTVPSPSRQTYKTKRPIPIWPLYFCTTVFIPPGLGESEVSFIGWGVLVIKGISKNSFYPASRLYLLFPRPSYCSLAPRQVVALEKMPK